MNKSTMVFNVGGKVFEISVECVYKSEVLKRMVTDPWFQSTHPGGYCGGTVFLDYNYDAFAVVLDFLRHDRIFVPPSVNASLVHLLLDQLKVYLTEDDKKALISAANTASISTLPPHTEDCPPQYSATYTSTPSTAEKRLIDSHSPGPSNLSDQLAISVHQKIANLIISTIRPRIESQALQGAYHTTYLLLPSTPATRTGTLMSEFPASTFTELVFLDADTEKFLRQSHVMARFQHALKQSVEVPMTFGRKDVFFRSENEFGILGTTTIDAIIIDFELGAQTTHVA